MTSWHSSHSGLFSRYDFLRAFQLQTNFPPVGCLPLPRRVCYGFHAQDAELQPRSHSSGFPLLAGSFASVTGLSSDVNLTLGELHTRCFHTPGHNTSSPRCIITLIIQFLDEQQKDEIFNFHDYNYAICSPGNENAILHHATIIERTTSLFTGSCFSYGKIFNSPPPSPALSTEWISPSSRDFVLVFASSCSGVGNCSSRLVTSFSCGSFNMLLPFLLLRFRVHDEVPWLPEGFENGNGTKMLAFWAVLHSEVLTNPQDGNNLLLSPTSCDTALEDNQHQRLCLLRPPCSASSFNRTADSSLDATAQLWLANKTQDEHAAETGAVSASNKWHTPSVQWDYSDEEGILTNVEKRYTSSRVLEKFLVLNSSIDYVLARGKQKKGRTTPREGKRIKQSNEQELEDDDDPELSLR
eukprot:Gb_39850 [translate_table: standard]